MSSDNENMLQIKQIEDFVKKICGDRPPSHNHLHMFKVRDNAKTILSWMITLYYVFVIALSSTMYVFKFISLFSSFVLECILLCFLVRNRDALKFMVELAALLHNVTDHKYVDENPDLTRNLSSFLTQLTSNPEYKRIVHNTVFEYLFNPKMIIDIIERISFSRQKKYGTSKFYSTLGLWGVLVRHIVSDADKLEAIGKKGIERCKEYTIEHFMTEKIYYTPEMVNKNIVKHYHEKLKLIASSEYMKTLPGWVYAQMLDREMNQIISALST